MVAKVVALKAPKEAALYFDEVLPFDFGCNAIEHALYGDEDDFFGFERLDIPLTDLALSNKVLDSLGHSNPAVEEIYREHLLRYTWILHASLLSNKSHKDYRQGIVEHEKFEPFRRLVKGSGANIDKVLREVADGSFNHKRYTKKIDSEVLGLIKRAGFSGAASWYGDGLSSNDGGKVSDYAVTLKGIKLVDPEIIPWEHLIEFRKDKQSMKRLRDFRILFHEEFQGKPKSYVEDRILAGLENHERAAKDWSFELIERTFSIVGSKASLGSSALAVATSVLAGAPPSIIAASGLAYSVVGASLEVAKVFRNRSEDLSSAYGYLSSLKKLEAP